MCDTYSEPCKRCGKFLPMHLGNFNTNRNEILAFCEDCFKGTELNEFNLKEQGNNIAVLWRYRETKEDSSHLFLIVALTRNAEKNANDNYPNSIDPEILWKGKVKEMKEATEKMVQKK